MRHFGLQGQWLSGRRPTKHWGKCPEVLPQLGQHVTGVDHSCSHLEKEAVLIYWGRARH